MNEKKSLGISVVISSISNISFSAALNLIYNMWMLCCRAYFSLYHCRSRTHCDHCFAFSRPVDMIVSFLLFVCFVSLEISHLLYHWRRFRCMPVQHAGPRRRRDVTHLHRFLRGVRRRRRAALHLGPLPGSHAQFDTHRE